MKGIRFQLWTAMMILVIFILILLWLFQIVFLENFYAGMRISNVRRQVTAMAQLSGDDDMADVQDRFDDFAFTNNLGIEWFNLEGKTVYNIENTSLSGHMPKMRNNIMTQAFQEVLEGKDVELRLSHPRFGNEFVIIGLPVSFYGESSGVMFVTMLLAPVEETANILKKQLLLITLILLAGSLLFSFILSLRFTRPILKIKNTTEKIAAGDLSARIKSKRKDEIGELAQTIDYMGEQLSKIEQLRRDLIANVSHELRTPLSLIRGYAETILDVTGDKKDRREKQLEIIIEEAERLSRLVDDILNLSQLQSGFFKLNKTSFNISELIDNTAARYEILSGQSGVSISRTGVSGLMVTADESRIGQVLYNLINNAFNHTTSGGAIAVKLLELNDSVRIEVSDTGSGISREELPHIWERYYKGDNTGDRKKCMGLGLAIVKGVLEAHGASFGVVSTSTMEAKRTGNPSGTTFWFELKK
jgi:signal transduction histidine kinase